MLSNIPSQLLNPFIQFRRPSLQILLQCSNKLQFLSGMCQYLDDRCGFLFELVQLFVSLLDLFIQCLVFNLELFKID